MAPSRVSEPKSFDYIVCGGGTSGCVVAGRLAEDPNVSVLIVEAGVDNEALENVHMPGGLFNLVATDQDWKIMSEPQKHANDRQIFLFRGRFLGGSSGCNGTLCIRGTKQDYDDWGIEGWTGDEVFEYMKKSETFHKAEWFEASKTDHGYDGPLHTQPYELAPISEKVKDAMIEKGVPFVHDMFTTGEVAHACGHAPRTVYNGYRTTAADFVTKTYRRDNTTILTEHTVDKVVIEHMNGELRATGVEVVAADGSRSVFQANREVIVSGGAFCSPTILMRSGIGAKEELSQSGIDCKVDLPGVGKNLMDHPLSFIFYETKDPQMSYDHMVTQGESYETTYKLWKDQRKGALSSISFGTFAWLRLDDRLKNEPLWQDAQKQAPEGRDPMGLTTKQPQVEFWNTELSSPFTQIPTDKQGAFAMAIILMNGHSRGTVKLHQSDILGLPVVDHNYLANPLDMLVMSEGCRAANEIIMEGTATRDLIKGAWPPQATHGSNKTREEWVPYVRETVTTCFHPSGTCKMVSSFTDDPMGVVDERLRVKGVRGLRVVDVSIMPILNNGHPQMAAFAIGEKAADMLKEDAKS